MGDKHQIADPRELASVGQSELEVGRGECLADAGSPLDARRTLAGCGRARECLVERVETRDGRAEIGETDIAVDEEVHLRVDIAECVSGLVEKAERHLLGEIEWRHDHIGYDVRELRIELVERGQSGAHDDDATDRPEDVVEYLGRMCHLPRFAFQQRDLLTVFADAREVETEVRLDPLQVEVEA